MKRIFILFISVCLFQSISNAQPGALSLNNVNASPYSCQALVNKGTYKQLRVRATQNGTNGTWEFPQDCTFPGNVWRPYNAQNATAIPFNTLIPSLPNTYAALWNSNNGGVSGKLSRITIGRYYTFNIENVTCTGGNCGNANMCVLETDSLPVNLNTVSQTPQANSVAVGFPVTITVTSSSHPTENVFLRYTTDAFQTSHLVPISFTDTIGTASIPGFSLGKIGRAHV